jgi:hypothetical protein
MRTFFPSIDLNLGGLPLGITEISGVESGLGKSEWALTLALLSQLSGRPAVYLDYGSNLNHDQVQSRAKSWGLDPNGLIVCKPVPEADLLDVAAEFDGIGLVVLDDLSSVVIEGTDGVEASRRAIRNLSLAFPNCPVLVTNQLRQSLARSGSYLETFLSKVCALRLLLSPSGVLRDGATEIGHKLKVTAHYPSRTMEDRVFTLYHTYRHGMDPGLVALTSGLKLGIVNLNGTHLFYKQPLGQGLLRASRSLIQRNLLGELLEDVWRLSDRSELL